MAKTSNTTAPPPTPPPQAASLLAWYDAHGRTLPWRLAAGRAPSPYHTWLSEIMLQQTTVATVSAYYQRFTDRWPTVTDLAAASEDEVLAAWAGLGYYSRARNLLKCARIVAQDHGGIFPTDVPTLRTLPGIGDYTANAIRAIAYDLPANVVDGNIERVAARVFAFTEPANTPKGKAALKRLAATIAPSERPGDYAQAAMDLGAMICTPRKPACPLCPWRDNCRAFAIGLTESIPVMRRKAPLPVRRASVFIVRDQNGRLLLRRQPADGLLGGLWLFPASPWDRSRNDSPLPDDPASHAPAPLDGFEKLSAGVIHVFTHFKLTIDIYVHRLPVVAATVTGAGDWFPANALPGMPTLGKKILAACRIALGQSAPIL